MVRHCALRFVSWLPLTLALFAFIAVVAIALTSATAHADDASSSPAGASRSEKSSEAAEHGPHGATGETAATTAKPNTADTTDAAAVDRPRTAGSSRPVDSSSRTGGKKPLRHLSVVRDAVSSGQDESGDPTPQREEDSSPVASRHDDATKPRPEKTSRHLDRRPRSVSASLSAPTVPSEHSPQTESSPVAVKATADTKVVALPAASSSGPVPRRVGTTLDQQVARFVRQLTGLASDTGIVGASLVNNLAAYAATAIGPQALWGVPYHIATGIAHTAGTVSKVLSGTSLTASSTGPFKVDYGVLDVLSFLTPTKVPAGANDPSIKVTAAHPLPVILVNGTVETQALNWSVGAPVLANAGYKVYTFNYGNVTPFPGYPIQSTADVRVSGAQLSTEIDRVLAETGAPKVILIGHSQGGGILPAYYLNVLGGADKVSQLIGLAPSNHGTDVDGLAGLLSLPVIGSLLGAVTDLIGPALGQQLVTSPFQQVVYGKGDTQPGVLYTTIASSNDEVVTPYTQQALEGPAVTNIVLQDQNPGLPTGHIGVAFTSQSWASVLDALARNPQANPQPVDAALAA